MHLGTSNPLRKVHAADTGITRFGVMAFRDLVELDVSNCGDLDDDAVNAIVDSSPELRLLKMANAGEVTDVSIRRLLELKGLWELDITGCHQVSLQVCARLMRSGVQVLSEWAFGGGHS